MDAIAPANPGKLQSRLSLALGMGCIVVGVLFSNRVLPNPNGKWSTTCAIVMLCLFAYSRWVLVFPHRRLGWRSLLAVVTVIAITASWVSYSQYWIRQRQHLATLTRNDWFFPTGRAPAGLGLFGERGVSEIVLTSGIISVEEAQRWFPEAKVTFNPDYRPWWQVLDDTE